MSVSNQLRQTISESGLTHYRIATDAGFAIRLLDRFMQGYELQTRTFDKLCDYFGLELRPARGRRKVAAKKAGTAPKQPDKKGRKTDPTGGKRSDG